MKWVPKVKNEKVNEKVKKRVSYAIDSFAIDNVSRITNILKLTNTLGSNLSRKYHDYVEGLNHNLFSVGQFCDADLEVAFQKSTCFVRDLQGNDLLTGSPTQAWLWHRRLSHLNFDYINLLSKKDVAEAIATTCYTQNRSIIIPPHEKMAYHIINDRKPSIKHLHIFSCSCYLTRDGENLDKMKEKGDPCILALDYDKSDLAPQLQNVSPSADTTVLSQQELDLFFDPLYDEFFTAGTSSVNKSSSLTGNSKQQDTPPTTNIQSSAELSTPTNVNAEENNDNQAVDTQVQQDEFINPFYTPIQEVDESSSCNIDNLNMHTFYQPHDSEYRWTKDHPLEQVCGNPSKHKLQQILKCVCSRSS
ncbi:integrase, catalytic region, zinc finger, CCHC-type containing protein [Tanacetum coccineum]